MIKKTISGFTLIELLMVISIITLLSSIFFSYIGSASAKSRDSVRLSDMKQINTAATMYYEDKGEVPESIDVLVNTGYLSSVPVDPKTKQPYTSQTAYVNGKRVFTASATYEKIYTTNSAGEEVSQQVGVIVGDIDMSNICNLISQFVDLTGNSVNINYPNCVSGISNDQIIGVTSGRRGGGGKSEEEKILWFDTGESLCWSAGDFEKYMGCSPGYGLTSEWYGAFEYCDNLSYNNSNNWRLPSVAELQGGFQNSEIFGTLYWSNEYFTKYWGGFLNAANDVYNNLEVYKPITSSVIPVICRLNE